MTTTAFSNPPAMGPALYGFNFGAPPSSSSVGVTNVPVSPTPATAPQWSPDNPMFWFAALLVVAAGCILYSGKVKVGFRTDAHAGDVHADVDADS